MTDDDLAGLSVGLASQSRASSRVGPPGLGTPGLPSQLATASASAIRLATSAPASSVASPEVLPAIAISRAVALYYCSLWCLCGMNHGSAATTAIYPWADGQSLRTRSSRTDDLHAITTAAGYGVCHK